MTTPPRFNVVVLLDHVSLNKILVLAEGVDERVAKELARDVLAVGYAYHQNRFYPIHTIQSITVAQADAE